MQIHQAHPGGTGTAHRRRFLAALTAAALACLAVTLLAAVPQARAGDLLKPPGSETFFGVTDTGDGSDFGEFARTVGKRPSVLETFHPWDNSLHQAMPRWRNVNARPMLHITTELDDGTPVIAPRGIADGGGDDYLLRLNRSFARHRIRAYVRPLGEPNRCLNPYAGVDCSGHRRSGKYSIGWYKQAFRRMYIILHGGGSKRTINRRLRAIKLPPLHRSAGKVPSRLPKAPIAVIWSPLPAGSPRVRANFPANYWPGPKYVDWVGTDFYSRYSSWKDLKRFYSLFAKRRKKPMALTEWALWGSDRPGFVKKLFRFQRHRKQVRMMVYYQDFGSSNAFRIQNFPASARVLKRNLRSKRFPKYAPHYLR